MRKITTSLLVTLSLAAGIKQCQAQSKLNLGILAGANMGTVSISHLDTAINNAIEGKNLYGFEAGFYAKLNIDPLYIKAAALYNFRAGEVNFLGDSNVSYTSAFNLHKLEVPLLLGLHLIGPLNIEAGPVYNYVIHVTENYHNNTVLLGRNGIGYRIGAMAELGPVVLGLSYGGRAVYTSGSDKAVLREPYKLIINVGLRFG